MIDMAQLPQLIGGMRAKPVSLQRLFLCWDTSDLPRRLVELYFNCKFVDLVQVIRIYDVTDIVFNGKNAHHFYEIVVPFHQGYWFVKGFTANRRYLAEAGVKVTGSEFFAMFRSNSVQIPSSEAAGNDFRSQKDFPCHQVKAQNQPPKWQNRVSTYSYYEEELVVVGEKDG